MNFHQLTFGAILCLLSLTSCANRTSREQSKPVKFGKVQFFDTVHHFGHIPIENPVDSFDFKFVNISDRMVVVLDAKTSCHCTKVDYSRKPIQAGDTSYIRVIYDGTGRQPEFFNKSVTVYTSAANDFIHLRIDGELK